MARSAPAGFTLVELMVVVAIAGILASIAIPNFIRFQARSKQSEAKINLKTIFVGQQTRYSEREVYTMSTVDVGFSPERGNRYEYDLGDNTGNTETVATAVTPACTVIESRAAAVAGVAAGQLCGVGIDTFAFGMTIVPTVLTSRGTVTWLSTRAGSPALTADGVGSNLSFCPNCDFSARAVGNIDGDRSGDEWWVSSQFGSIVTGTACSELTVSQSPGAALNTYNDVTCGE